MNFYVSLRLSDLIDNTTRLEEYSLNAEVYIDAEVLDTYLLSAVEKIREELKNYKIKVNVHGPYIDLNPGYQDNYLREAVVRRMCSAIEYAQALGAGVIIFHSPFKTLKFEEIFLENTIKTYEKVLKFGIEHGLKIAIENIYDNAPGMLRRFFDYFSSDYLVHCFDIGHFNIFVKEYGVEEWIESFHDVFALTHIHNNDGKEDQHLSLGNGIIDIESYLNLLKKKNLLVPITIENRNERDVIESIKWLKEKKYL